jgi:hypothetical protein
MRKHLMITMALGALIALTVAGVAVAAKDTVVRAGNLEVTIDGSSGVTPKALSKSKYTPIAFTAAGSVRSTNAAEPQPAPLKEVLLDTKNAAVNVKGYPACPGKELQARDTAAVEAACKPAIIGKGTTTISVKFPEQPPIPAKSPLLVFNGGTSGGTTTFYIHAYLTQPITTAIVTTLKITKEHSGRYGTKTVASIPLIANGAGSVTDFSLTIDKKFTYKGKKVSVLTAKCSDGKLLAHATAIFRDVPPTKVSAEILNTCTPKG